jgi:molybdate transport system ATP-binding protein
MIAVEVRKRLGTFDLDVAFEAGRETMVLFGRSGSGKSRTLAAIAGLMRPDAGSIRIDGRTLFDAARGIDLPPQQRNLGYLVQEIALFPHLTVEENIAFGLGGWRREARAARVRELQALLRIEDLGARTPAQLSGGQQQRVALARALARPVDALLLDEPFSALDEALRADLRAELLRLRRELDIPIVCVTHDLREAHLLADRIAVIEEGRVLQSAPRADVFLRPASRRVAELTGVRNIFAVRGLGGTRVEIASMPFEVAVPAPEGAALDVCIRSERCLLRRLDPGEALPANCFVADITSELAFGSTYTLRLDPVAAGPAVEVEVSAHPYDVLGIATRPRWVVELPTADLHVMPRTAAMR